MRQPARRFVALSAATKPLTSPAPPRKQVRELLLRKQEALVAGLRALAARVPRAMLAAAGAKFAELERQLRAKAATLEDVDAQRRWVLACGVYTSLECHPACSAHT
jgi:hypothetical protein